MPDKRSSILIVGMADSVHLARWLSQFSHLPIDFVIFPSSPHRHVHPILKELISSTTHSMTVVIKPPSMLWLALPLSALDIPFKNWSRSRLLRRLIESSSFDLIHVLEIQHAGYLLLDTGLTDSLPKVCVTNWGSDIYWFRQFPKHKRKIVQLLKLADMYSAECHRDIEIVRALGYSGITMPVVPNSGGINLDEIPKDSLPPSQRNRIMIKGYTGFVGKALVALKACERIAEYLHNYEVIVYSASIKSRIRALKLRHVHGIRVTILKKRTAHQEVLRHFSESRIYIGISLSDGISTSLLEAMATGCYPIQTNTSCADEWLRATSGSIVPSTSTEVIAKELLTALKSDELVDSASATNKRKIAEFASKDVVLQKASTFYSAVL